MITLDSATNEQILLELINRFGMENAPASITLNGDYHRCIVETETAEVTLIFDHDDYRALLDAEL